MAAQVDLLTALMARSANAATRRPAARMHLPTASVKSEQKQPPRTAEY